MVSSEFLLFPTPILSVKGCICHTCLRGLDDPKFKLNKCGKCRRVFYCSPDCQKKDWKKGHKALCPVLVKINCLLTSTVHRTWEEYRSEMWTRVDVFRSQVPRPSPNDERILTYEPRCALCHRNSFQLLQTESLHVCHTCHLVHHCSTCPKTTHSAACLKYMEISSAEFFSIDHYLATGEVCLQMPTTKPRATYIPVSTAKNWYDYYTQISDKQMITGIISSDLKPLADNEEMALALAGATDKSTIMITIIAALEAVFPDLGTKKSIRLHIIGATAKELDALMLFEELFHLLPALKKMHCSFIGPELPTPVNGNEVVTLDCCSECTKAGRTRSMDMFKLSYHDYVSSKEYKKPDLGVSFHTGHSQEAMDSWKPTIEWLAKAQHPTMFTCFNKKEMTEEVEGFKKMGTRFVVEGEKNKWKGMRPLLEVIEEEEDSVYYNNQYWYVIAGGSS